MNLNDRTYSESGGEVSPEPESSDRQIVRTKKQIQITAIQSAWIDTRIVSPIFYNAFNYDLIARGKEGGGIIIGVTSPNPREGKTVVASNLAVSLAVAERMRTVLVDVNTANPAIHSAFGLPSGPGLRESLRDSVVHVFRHGIENLFVLSIGASPTLPGQHASSGSGNVGAIPHRFDAVFQLQDVTAFRDVMYSLREEFEFVIVDLPSFREERFPILLTSQFDGILVVVREGKTRMEEIGAVIQRFPPNKLLGFVLNETDSRTEAKGSYRA